jgi:hypothetical protein
MKTQLDNEIAASTPTALEKAQFTIQKQWLSQKLGHLEVIMYPGPLPPRCSNGLDLTFVPSGYFAFSGPKANTSYISLLMAIQHPFSRGKIVCCFFNH